MSKEDKELIAFFLTVIIMFIAINTIMYCTNMMDNSPLPASSHCSSRECECEEKYETEHKNHNWFMILHCNIKHGNFLNNMKQKTTELCGNETIASFTTNVTKFIFGLVMIVTLLADGVLFLISFVAGAALLLILLVGVPFCIVYILVCITLIGFDGEKCNTTNKEERKATVQDKSAC